MDIGIDVQRCAGFCVLLVEQGRGDAFLVRGDGTLRLALFLVVGIVDVEAGAERALLDIVFPSSPGVEVGSIALVVGLRYLRQDRGVCIGGRGGLAFLSGVCAV